MSDTDELPLCVVLLEMETTQDALGTAALIILDEFFINPGFSELSFLYVSMK